MKRLVIKVGSAVLTHNNKNFISYFQYLVAYSVIQQAS